MLKRRTAKKKRAPSVGGTTHSNGRTLRAKLVAAKIIENPRLSVSAAAREVGLSDYMATHPSVITNTPEWAELLEQYLPRTDLLSTHKGLLKASRIDHMTFIAEQIDFKDSDITEMFTELNCTVRKIIHRDTGARDVYFWSPDNKTRATALDLAYKLLGSYAADKAAVAFSLASLARLRMPASTPVLPEGGNTEPMRSDDGLRMPMVNG